MTPAERTATVAALLAEGLDLRDVGAVRRRLGMDATPEAVVAELARRRRLALPLTRPRDGDPRLITCGDGMPDRLAATWSQGGPLWLWVRGALDDGPAVAVVGTRTPSLDGVRIAEALGEGLAAAGVVVVSGLARGIDQAAHRGALRVGRTVAVLGTGHDVDYPRDTDELRAEIARRGAVASEYPPGHGIRHRSQFLARNRILAGLADAVVVVEAGARSGALNTAGLAGDLGRDVMAVPSSPSNRAAAGTLALLVDGAIPVRDADDVLAAVGLDDRTTATQTRSAAVDVPDALPPDARAVLELVSTVPATPSALAQAVDLEPRQVLVALSVLEDAGLVTQRHSGVVRR